MSKFLRKISLFLLPLIVLMAFPLIVLFRSGEIYNNLEKTIHSNNKYLIGYAYNEQNIQYLKSNWIQQHEVPKVVVLGSSRALQFRDSMFTSSFYNAGYSIKKLSDFKPFVSTLFKEKQPDVLIICIDQWMFNSNWDSMSDYNSSDTLWSKEKSNKIDFKTQFSVWKDLFDGKYSFFTSKNSENGVLKIGLNALVNNKGIRNDGSMFYGDQIQKLINDDHSANDYHFSDTYSRISSGSRRFEFGESINPNAIIALKEVIEVCRNKGIYVIAYIPPFAKEVYDKMKASENYTYLDKIYPKISNIFNNSSSELWDFTKIESFTNYKLPTLDGFHASEVHHQLMLLHMIENGSRISNYCDKEALMNSFSKRINDFIVYDY